MKHIWTGFIILFIIFVGWKTSFAFRCQGKIIDKSFNKSEILDYCGDPTRIDESQEERVIYNCLRRYNRFDDHDRADENYNRIYRGTHRDCIVYVNLEEWFYNLGPLRLTQTLVFENNRLIHIRTGKYGY